MLSTKEITKVYKGTKITSRVDLYKTTKRRVKKQSTAGIGEQCCEISQTAKIRRLQNLQVANFRNPAKFPLSSPSL